MYVTEVRTRRLFAVLGCIVIEQLALERIDTGVARGYGCLCSEACLGRSDAIFLDGVLLLTIVVVDVISLVAVVSTNAG